MNERPRRESSTLITDDAEPDDSPLIIHFPWSTEAHAVHQILDNWVGIRSSRFTGTT